MHRIVAVLLAVAVVVPAGAAAHGNDLEVDSQVSADGTVVVENVLLVVDGFLVVHRDADGAPGEAIGHAAPDGDSATGLDVRVPIDDAAWSAWGDNRTVWVVIHRDEGAEGFDPGEDPIERSFGTVTGERIQLGSGERESSVVAADFSIQRTGSDAVTVRRVAIGEDGLLAVRSETGDGDGRVIGATALEAGVHENVTVPVNGSVFASRGRRLSLIAALYHGDGPTVTDGDRPFRVGGEPIRTEFTVERTGSLGAGNATGGRAPATPTRTTEPLVVTATPEATSGGRPTTTGSDGAAGATGVDGPGLGGTVAVAAVLATVGAFVAARRRLVRSRNGTTDSTGNSAKERQ